MEPSDDIVPVDACSMEISNTNKIILTKESTKVESIVDNVLENPMDLKQVTKTLVQSVVDGVNGCLLCGGSVNTLHTIYFQGEEKASFQNQASVGFIAIVLEQLIELLEQKTEVKFYIRIAFVEFYEESISVLLHIQYTIAQDLFTTKKTKCNLKNATRLGPIVSIEKIIPLITQARTRRNIGMTASATPAAEFTSALFRIYVKQVQKDSKVIYSTLDLYDLPGLNRLQRASNTFGIVESSLLNKSIYALDNVVKALQDPLTNPFPPYDTSELTQIMNQALGGDCLTLACFFIVPNDFNGTKCTLQFANSLQKINNFPLVHTEMVEGLQRRYDREAMYLRSELNNAQKSSSCDNQENILALMNKAHELEGKCKRENLEKIKVKEQSENLVKTIAEYRAKYQTLVESEVALRKQVLDSEREKLRLSKALVDLQLEHTCLAEGIEKDKFEITTKLLNAENDILELQMREEQHQIALKSAQESATKATAEKRELGTEFIALKSNFVQLNANYQKEAAKAQQLSVELLTLVNQKKALSAVPYLLKVEDVQQINKELIEKQAKTQATIEAISKQEETLSEKLSIETKKCDELRADKAELEFKIKTMLIDADTRQLQYEKTSHEALLQYQSDIQLLKRKCDDDNTKAQIRLEEVNEQLKAFEVKSRQLTREIEDFKRNLSEKSQENEILQQTTYT
ncbi:Kinesin motor domain containing protein [Thraustotheca clavata]|uniref:Kinesin motor domain containing protein n=1 Tax=Thraustotheca clavata TaxID=74557 RepID=A0A1V9YTP2_9STRA|nr:Kinesin motor domain containing protein [Thraustotheca clavata]